MTVDPWWLLYHNEHPGRCEDLELAKQSPTVSIITKDLDILIGVDKDNATAAYKALKEFGAPLAGLTEADFGEDGYFYHMGRPPMLSYSP